MPGEAPDLTRGHGPVHATPPAATRADLPGSAAGRLARRGAGWGVFVLAGLLLWYAYLRVSRTYAVNSDGASQALQAWDMLHGNLLLHGWQLSDVAFYTTELPEYMLVEAIRGLNADVMHVSAALTYTLLVLLAGLLARGDATGGKAVARMLMAAGITLAPQLGTGTYILLLNPDHVGTSVAAMAIFLVLDRATRRRWWVPVVAGVLLAWVLVADSVILYTAIIPIVVVSGARVFQEVAVRRQPLARCWFEVAVAAAAVAAVPAGYVALALIHAHGGFYEWSSAPSFAPAARLGSNLRLTFDGLAALFGFGLSGVSSGLATALAVVHMVGAAVAGCAVCAGVVRFVRETSLVTRVLTVAVLLNLVAYVLSTAPQSAYTGREFAAVLPFSAVLAGRLFADRLAARQLAPVLAAGLLGYSLALAYDAVQAPVPASDSQITTWLEGHHLDYGLGGYWDASVVTLSSGNHIQVRPVCYGSTGFTTDGWEAQASWYSPGLHHADFLVMTPGGGYGGLHSLADGGFANCYPPTYPQVVAAFGEPAHVYRVGGAQILVWKKNLLPRLG